MLNLTVIFDHNVVDGARVTRFVRRLVELIGARMGLKLVGARRNEFGTR